MKKFALCLSFVSVLAMMSTPVLFADSVTHDRWHDSYRWVDQQTCSFPVYVSGESEINDLWFLDDNGDPVRLLSTVNHAEIDFSANGKTLTAKGSGGVEYEYNPDHTVSGSTFGINLLLTLPHYGTIILDTGHAEYLFDGKGHPLIFQAGPAVYDNAAFCAALR